MKNHPKFGEFWQILFNEYNFSKERMFRNYGFQNLVMEEEACRRKSVKIREKNSASVVK
jgi:phosphoenolpyruvate carboxylase